MDNKMEKIAGMFGLAFSEEFDLKHCKEETMFIGPLKFKKEGLYDKNGDDRAILLSQMLRGEYQIVKRPFVPNVGQLYYCNTPENVVIGVWFDGGLFDYSMFIIGNVFATKPEARLFKFERLDEFNKNRGKIRNGK